MDTDDTLVKIDPRTTVLVSSMDRVTLKMIARMYVQIWRLMDMISFR